MSPRVGVARTVERLGQWWTVKSVVAAPGPNAWTAGATTTTYRHVKARQRLYRPHEIRGTILERDALITISPKYLAPIDNDQIIMGKITEANDVGLKWMRVISVYIPTDGKRVGSIKAQVRA